MCACARDDPCGYDIYLSAAPLSAGRERERDRLLDKDLMRFHTCKCVCVCELAVVNYVGLREVLPKSQLQCVSREVGCIKGSKFFDFVNIDLTTAVN